MVSAGLRADDADAHAVGVLQKLRSLVGELIVVAASLRGRRGSPLHLHQKCSRLLRLYELETQKKCGLP